MYLSTTQVFEPTLDVKPRYGKIAVSCTEFYLSLSVEEAQELADELWKAIGRLKYEQAREQAEKEAAEAEAFGENLAEMAAE